MEHSAAYNELLESIKSYQNFGFDGYNQNLIHEIYEEERNEIEDIIWNQYYQNKDHSILTYFPFLKKYDGIHVLEQECEKQKVGTSEGQFLAYLLYEESKQDKWLELMVNNLQKSKYNPELMTYFLSLSFNDKVYQMLKKIYVSCTNEDCLLLVVNGLALKRGYISDPFSFSQLFAIDSFSDVMISAKPRNREEMLAKYEKGELDSLVS